VSEMSSKLQDSLNAQVGSELASAHLYLAMAAQCAGRGFAGACHWLRLQHKEETEHATRIIDHLVDRNARVAIGAIEAPGFEFKSLVQTFDAVLRHEQSVTKKIHALYEVALAEKDYATQVFLHPFISEQVEEEASALGVLDRLKYVEERPGSVIFIDKELGKRSATAT
jgi:ferritin